LYRALLFDLDGTLAETDSLHLPTWVDVLRPYGIEVDEEYYKARISGRSNSKIVEDLLPDLSAEDRRDLAEAKEASFRKHAGELEPLPGLLNFMEEAKDRGLSLALVTNAPERTSRRSFWRLISGCSSTSSCSLTRWDPSSPTRPPTRPRSKGSVSVPTRPSPSRTRPRALPRPSGPASRPSVLPPRKRRRR
jgi:hypothetical protein